ncbi:MAG: hypothetical protein JSU63_13435 [Phycisphaerales bacterium]|nr:MAG: hypothetical protein JSU63_13435 [Phycisphaerales bacterium]
MGKFNSIVPFICCLYFAAPALGQEGNGPAAGGEASAGELAKKTQNPVSDLISVPFENNFGFGAGADGEFRYDLIIKPVIPMSINEDWNWINRVIIPVSSQPNLRSTERNLRERGFRRPVVSAALGRAFDGDFGEACGIGDIQYQGYLSPAKPSKTIWGVGPVLEFPTASEDVLGSEKWSAGAGFVALRMDGPWVYGGLINNIWSFAGDGDRRHVNRMTFQPFVNYNLPKGWYLTSSPVITANWAADSDDTWTIPIGGGVGRIIRFGKLPVNVTLQSYYNIEKPDLAPDWGIRFQFALLFPKG